MVFINRLIPVASSIKIRPATVSVLSRLLKESIPAKIFLCCPFVLGITLSKTHKYIPVAPPRRPFREGFERVIPRTNSLSGLERLFQQPVSALGRSLCCVLFAGWLAACSVVPGPSTTETGIENTAAADEEKIALMPDPYLAQAKPLPAGAAADFEQAQQAMAAQQWQNAQSLLEQMTQLYPSLSGPYVNLGLVYRQQNKSQLAIDAFKRAIAVNPLNSSAYNQLGVLYREQGEFQQAEQSYLQALEVWPHNAVVHRNLGILYDLYMGRFAEALQHYQMSQKVAAEPERRIEGWIVDLQRRMTDQQAALP